MSTTPDWSPFGRSQEPFRITADDERLLRHPPEKLVVLVPVEIEEDVTTTDDDSTTVDLVARAVRNADPEGWLTGPGGVLAPYYEAAAERILDALRSAGRLLPEGGRTEVEWGIGRLPGRIWPAGTEAEARAYAKTDTVNQAHRRRVTEWPDGARFVGPWELVPDAEADDE